jgi:hypothetical protein
MPNAPGNTSFSITLPDEVIETMMFLLAGKMYGTNRAEIARALILDMLKTEAVQRAIEKEQARHAAKSS